MNNSSDEIYKQKISIYRDDIDMIDKELVALLERRMNSSKAIGLLKKEHNIDILDKSREALIIENRLNMLKNKEYENYLKDIYSKIMEISREIQL